MVLPFFVSAALRVYETRRRLGVSHRAAVTTTRRRGDDNGVNPHVSHGCGLVDANARHVRIGNSSSTDPARVKRPRRGRRVRGRVRANRRGPATGEYGENTVCGRLF